MACDKTISKEKRVSCRNPCTPNGRFDSFMCFRLQVVGSVLAVAVSLLSVPVRADVQVESKIVHLRIEGPREWSSFPETPDAHLLKRSFVATQNATPVFLRLRQQDVKQIWHVELNGTSIGKLRIDENDMVEYFVVPAGGVIDGENELRIYQDEKSAVPDDVRIGEVVLGETDVETARSEFHVEIRVIDEGTGKLLPSRITVTNSGGALQAVGATSNDHLAVRPGIVYTSTGVADFGLPAGEYTVMAGRGFEYSLATAKVEGGAGMRLSKTLSIRREVPTDGYVACDTHVHTLTHSGHGDATVQERMITLAAEGVELPIATDHNAQIDHRPFAAEMRVAEYFTPVIGNEVTTTVGHFNIWPTAKDSPLPNHKLTDWGAIADELFGCAETRVAILNHPRDLHAGTRPFGPELHNSVTGANLNGSPIRFNGMEVVNSGATQTNIMQLFHDWMGLLNAGYRITPVGCSDSHDVGRHFVGQGRTYIRCDDRDPGNIDVIGAADAFINGTVMVSYGLLCEMTVNGKYQSGSVVQPASDHADINVRVLGPHWTKATELLIFANGIEIHSIPLNSADVGKDSPGVHADINWSFDLPSHDMFLTAIALGPGIDGLHWKTAKAYQPDSPDWTDRTIGCSGAIWIDADKDGRQMSAVDYARRTATEAAGDLKKTIESLATFDAAIAAQAASFLQQRGIDILAESSQTALHNAEPHVQQGFREYQRQWRDNEIARNLR